MLFPGSLRTLRAVTGQQRQAAMAQRDHDTIEIRRIYEALGRDGSYRVLVDRLSPRGVKKDDAALESR
jgi:Protein of unknown function, DUF488